MKLIDDEPERLQQFDQLPDSARQRAAPDDGAILPSHIAHSQRTIKIFVYAIDPGECMGQRVLETRGKAADEVIIVHAQTAHMLVIYGAKQPGGTGASWRSALVAMIHPAC
jgi:hypothetical protein